MLNNYRRLATLSFTAFLIFLALNALIIVAAFAFYTPPGSLQYDHALLASVYPDMAPADRDAMLVETWSRPFTCESFTHFGEASHVGQYVNVTAAGYRCNATCAPWPPERDTYNIFVFGGSTTFGYGVPDWQTIPAYLEVALNDTALAPVAVYNFGAGHYFGPQEAVRLQMLLADGHAPDMAIFIDGTNEFKSDITSPMRELCGAESHPEPFTWPLVRVVQALMAQPVVAEADPITADDVLARWMAVRQAVRGMGDAFGFETLFVVQPVPGIGYDVTYHPFASDSAGITSPAQVEGYARIAAGEWTGEEDVLDLSGIQVGRREALYVDQVHYTARFSREIAGRIAAFIAMIER